LEELVLFHLVRLDSLASRFPSSGADFTMFIRMLKSLDKSESFVNTATNSGIVHLHHAESSLSINDVETTESSSVKLIIFVINKDVIISRHVLRDISEERIVHVTETSFSSGSVNPSKMGEMRVCGYSQYLSVDVFKFLDTVRERDQFSWANVSEIERVEDQYNVFSLVITQ
jgi:hypothetical protein